MQIPMTDKTPAPPATTPRFGRLLLVCALSVLLCGVLVWLMGDQFAECCDLSWLDRLSPKP
jgi:hypothetical protein